MSLMYSNIERSKPAPDNLKADPLADILADIRSLRDPADAVIARCGHEIHMSRADQTQALQYAEENIRRDFLRKVAAFLSTAADSKLVSENPNIGPNDSPPANPFNAPTYIDVLRQIETHNQRYRESPS